MSEPNGELTLTNLTEDTARLILQRLDEIHERLLANGTAAQVTNNEREDGRQRVLDNQSDQGNNFLIPCPDGNLVVEVIQRVLVDNFNIPQGQAKSVQKSITVHLQRVICRYISEKLREAGLQDTIPWLSIPETIYKCAVERFNQKARRVLNIDLSRCQGDWLVYHALHSGWNNKGKNRNERRCKRQQAREQLEEQRFRLSPSPPPSGNDQVSEELLKKEVGKDNLDVGEDKFDADEDKFDLAVKKGGVKKALELSNLLALSNPSSKQLDEVQVDHAGAEMMVMNSKDRLVLYVNDVRYRSEYMYS
ncbi:hypothetical protein BJV82DRAFT_664043 [Fennellomyces sp. T-0311]|nr:hypothetical protein BJV82DRAFT_664043 [Fennellomyces sp. T-0311]